MTAAKHDQDALRALFRVSQSLGSPPNLSEVLNQVLDAVISLTGAERGFLMLYDPETDVLDLQVGRNIEQETLETESMEISRPLVRRVLADGAGIMTPNARLDPRFSNQDSVDGYARGAIMCTPLYAHGSIRGAIYVDRRMSTDAFSEEDLNLLDVFAAQAAIGIENARLYQAVQDANLAKSKFVSVVSHELRLPMTSIKGYTDLILQGTTGEINEMQRGFLEIVRKSVDRMGMLISDLQDISRIETGRLTLALAKVDLRQYLQQVLMDLKPRTDEKDLKVLLDIEGDLPAVTADPNRLVQVLNNLIDNAWKYTPEEGAIRVSAIALGGFVRVSVMDSGFGITPEDQEKLFTPFFRSEDSRVREQPGWGLGLNVARNLVELMGGELGVKSTLDRGSTFWFTLPEA